MNYHPHRLPVAHDGRPAQHPRVVVDVRHRVGEVQVLGPDERDPGLDGARPTLHHPLDDDLEGLPFPQWPVGKVDVLYAQFRLYGPTYVFLVIFSFLWFFWKTFSLINFSLLWTFCLYGLF